MHDVRPLECERTRHALSVGLDESLSPFECSLVEAHLARCATCCLYEARIKEVAQALRSAPSERLSTPIDLPSRRIVAWGTVARATSVAAAAGVAGLAFIGLAAAPDRSAWQDDAALIAAALDRPAGTNELLIDIVRPTMVSRGTSEVGDEAVGIGAVKPPLRPGL